MQDVLNSMSCQRDHVIQQTFCNSRNTVSSCENPAWNPMFGAITKKVEHIRSSPPLAETHSTPAWWLNPKPYTRYQAERFRV